MRKTLFVNCAGNPKYCASEHIKPFLRQPYEIINAEFENLPADLSCYSHAIIGGSIAPSYESPWQSRLYSWVERLINHDIPTLGICYGHQILVRVYLGKQYVRKRDCENIGWDEITLVADDLLLGTKGDIWVPFAFHGYELYDLPADQVCILAKSKNCDVMAYKLIGKKIYGVQPHFEISRDKAIELLRSLDMMPTKNVIEAPTTYDRHHIFFERFFSL